jgi:oligoribonuclease
MLVWMDLEMTGLDHTRDVIVEIATLVTDDDLQIVAEGPDLVVHQSADVLAAWIRSSSRCTPVRAARGHRGVHHLAGRGRRPTLEFIVEHVPEARTVPLCGNSIGTDRRFLAAYLPEIEEHLHYRSSTSRPVKELVKRWYPDVP